MQVHEMGLQKKYYEAIAENIKKIECRLNDKKRQRIKVGDKVVFHVNGQLEKYHTRVKGLLYYPTFKELVEDFPIEWTSGDKNLTREEFLKVMEEFYPIEKQKQVGVVGIRLGD